MEASFGWVDPNYENCQNWEQQNHPPKQYRKVLVCSPSIVAISKHSERLILEKTRINMVVIPMPLPHT